MKKYKDVVLFEDERLQSGLGESLKYTEMSPFDRAFLCGLIRERRPHKILEVGMSAGATSAVILNCIQVLNLETKLVSVDYSEEWYKDSSRKTGFVAEEFKASQPEYTFSREVYLGDVVAAYLEDICKDGKIDFLILDTTHSLPGEVLDFIACYPYLTEDAVVVLHDVMLSIKRAEWSNAIATKLLFDTVKADKYYMWRHEEKDSWANIANIAAFQLTEDTGENMLDVFSVLEMGWSYIPKDADLEKYRACLSKNYETYFMDFFASAIKIESWVNLKNIIQKHCLKSHDVLERYWRKTGNVLLYGCGFWGEIYCKYADIYQLPVAGMVVSDEITITDSMREKFQAPIYHLSELPYEKDECRIILAIGEENRELFLKNCKDRGLKVL